MVRLVRDAVADSVTADAIVRRFQSLTVRCVSDRVNLESYSGQTAIVTFVALVARMGVHVDLEIPDVELIGPQPPLYGTRLRTALMELGQDLVPGSVISAEPGMRVDATFVFGDTPLVAAAMGWRITGTSWSGAITDTAQRGNCWNATDSIGGMTAAALAAPEVFKFAVRSLPLRHPIWTEFLAPCRSASWDFQGDLMGWPAEPVSVDIVSAGAITQSALFALSRVPVHLVGRLFDDDTAGLSNINRQMLLRRSDIGPKVEVVARRAALFTCTPVLKRFRLPDSGRYLPLADHILVGVDDIPARWDIQRATDQWLGVGATSHFYASVSSHEPGQGCAGCLHPRDEELGDGPIPTVAFVSFWAGLVLAVRLLRKVGGRPYSLAQQHVGMWPLRLDRKTGAKWSPVPPRADCPVTCKASAGRAADARAI
jgi:ThiF family protein